MTDLPAALQDYLMVRRALGHKLLLHPSSVTALLHYAVARDHLWPVAKTKAFFISLRGNRLVSS